MNAEWDAVRAAGESRPARRVLFLASGRSCRLIPQLFEHIGVKTLALQSRLRHELPVDFRRHAYQKLPGKRLLPVFSPSGTEVEAILHGIPKGLFQLLHRRAFKGDYIARVDHLSM